MHKKSLEKQIQEKLDIIRNIIHSIIYNSQHKHLENSVFSYLVPPNSSLMRYKHYTRNLLEKIGKHLRETSPVNREKEVSKILGLDRFPILSVHMLMSNRFTGLKIYNSNLFIEIHLPTYNTYSLDSPFIIDKIDDSTCSVRISTNVRSLRVSSVIRFKVRTLFENSDKIIKRIIKTKEKLLKLKQKNLFGKSLQYIEKIYETYPNDFLSSIRITKKVFEVFDKTSFQSDIDHYTEKEIIDLFINCRTNLFPIKSTGKFKVNIFFDKLASTQFYRSRIHIGYMPYINISSFVLVPLVFHKNCKNPPNIETLRFMFKLFEINFSDIQKDFEKFKVFKLITS